MNCINCNGDKVFRVDRSFCVGKVAKFKKPVYKCTDCGCRYDENGNRVEWNREIRIGG